MRVLIADDDPISSRILESKLIHWGYEVMVCSDGLGAWEVLRTEGAPQLAIIDWMMPGMDGLEICRSVREQTPVPYTYILLLTGRDRKEDILTGLSAGADDFLSKPFDSHELDVRLRIGRRILDLEGGLLRSREALRIQATHDPLTGVWNRGAAIQSFEKELHRSYREAKPVALIMADIDHFKLINDTYGHLAGDAALREVCRRMRSLMRHYDTIGRYGGEEFLIVLPGCDNAEAQHIAERIREEIGSQSVKTLEGELDISISLGVAVGDGSRKLDPNALIRAADAALYRSKRTGRNRVTVATPADIKDCELSHSPSEPLSALQLADDPLRPIEADRSTVV
ncbi:MAG: diguanylate cyclase [Acidobacteriota bacterium]